MKKLMFASDLDRTLIYSSRFIVLEEGDSYLQLPGSSPYELIETKDGQPISFMTKKAIEQLREITKSCCFVPATTRTVAQYQRIHLFQTSIQPEYAITSNGGHILHHNEPDLSWYQGVLKRVEHESMNSEDLMARFSTLTHDSWMLGCKKADDLFFTCQVNPELIPEQEVSEFSTWAETQGWSISFQGRKLYLVPRSVNKGIAAREVGRRLGLEYMVGAGDSLLDLPLLESADVAYAASHGEIMKRLMKPEKQHQHIEMIHENGIVAAESILRKVQQMQQSYSCS